MFELFFWSVGAVLINVLPKVISGLEHVAALRLVYTYVSFTCFDFMHLTYRFG